MKRLVVLAASLIVGIVAAAPASASTVTSGNDTFRIKGTVLTTADMSQTTDPMQPLIVTSDVGPSTISGLGRVVLHQRQVVTPDVSGPAFGTHARYSGTITSTVADPSYFVAADGSRLYFTFTTSFQAFEPSTSDFPAGVPWPIAFPGDGMAPFVITFTGGTGRFEGASGTAQGSGSYCFRYNQGYYLFSGEIVLPSRI